MRPRGIQLACARWRGGSDRKTERRVQPARAGAFFAGRRHDRFSVGQELGGKVYDSSGSELTGRRCLARWRTEELPAAGGALSLRALFRL